MKIGSRLNVFVDDRKLGTVFCNDTGFVSERDPDTVRGPDVSFWSKSRLPELPEGYIEIPPDLAVEVVSPGDRFGRLRGKIEGYLEHGVRLVWVVDPLDRSVTVYRPGVRDVYLPEDETLTGGDVVPEFSIAVKDLFD